MTISITPQDLCCKAMGSTSQKFNSNLQLFEAFAPAMPI